MADVKELAVLAPEPAVIRIGNQEYTVTKFCLAKSLRTLSMMTSMSDKIDLSATMAEGAAIGWVPALVAAFPKLVEVAEPQVFNLMALVLIPNRRIFEIIEREENLDTEIARVAKELKLNEDMDFEKMFQIVQVGYERMGLEALKENFKTLLAKFTPEKTEEAPADETNSETETQISG